MSVCDNHQKVDVVSDCLWLSVDKLYLHDLHCFSF